MDAGHAQFTGSIPELYDRYLGPLFFEPYAKDIATRLEKLRASNVLELACGTGIVTRRLRDVMPLNGHLLATDLNQAMLDYAALKFSGDDSVKFEQMDATSLTLPSGAFDAIVCQFGWMFFPDKLAAMREAHRVLALSGYLLFNVWDSFAENPLGWIAHETIGSFFETDPPLFYQTPFGFSDVDEIRRMLKEARFTTVDVETVTCTAESPSANDAALGLVRGNPVVNSIHERGTAKADTIVQAVAEALRREVGDLPLHAPMKAHVIVAHSAG
jgi:ubiquinone/menaquinone biosynthesis C-methylase UbiE